MSELSREKLVPVRIGHEVYSRPTKIVALLKGFSEIRCVTYVTDPRTILKLFEEAKCERLEMTVQQSEAFRTQIAKADAETVTRILRLIDDGRLKVYGTTRAVHAKLFLAQNGMSARVVVSTGNLDGSQSMNVVVWFDYEPSPRLTPYDPSLLPAFESWSRDLAAFEEVRTPCLSDLVGRVHMVMDEEKRREAVRNWQLAVAVGEDVAAGAEIILQQVTGDFSQGKREVIVEIRNPVLAREIERSVGPSRPRREGGTLYLTVRDVASANTLVPVMRVSPDLSDVRILARADAEFLLRSARPEDPKQVDNELALVERYVEGVELGKTRNQSLKDFTKAAMFEAFLYVLSSPFFSEHMSILRQSLPYASHRGPRYLYALGHPRSGKTSLFIFALAHLAGNLVDAYEGQDRKGGVLKGKEFKMDIVEGTRRLGTCFPLVFDDIEGPAFSKKENELKDYWQKEHNPGLHFPQLIVGSNDPPRKEWMEGRIKVLDFDVQFPKYDSALTRRLNELTGEARRSSLFPHFAHYYLEELRRQARTGALDFEADELAVGRIAMKRLYEVAGRDRPKFFLERPAEDEANIGQRRWKTIVDLGLVELKNLGDVVVVHFSKDLTRADRQEYVAYLAGIKHEPLRGDKLVIEDAEAFFALIGQEPTRGLVRHVFRGLRPKR